MVAGRDHGSACDVLIRLLAASHPDIEEYAQAVAFFRRGNGPSRTHTHLFSSLQTNFEPGLRPELVMPSAAYLRYVNEERGGFDIGNVVGGQHEELSSKLLQKPTHFP